MKNRILLLIAFVAFCLSLKAQEQPNVLLITLDDMNWDSVGVYGNTLAGLTPNMDKLAEEGVLFEKAYVITSNCSPSRTAIQSGQYPHQTGVRGFYYAQPDKKTLPEILKDNGYQTGIINKAPDTSLSPDFERYWDVVLGFNGAAKRSAAAYTKQTKAFLSKVTKKPFYCVVNIADPHKPFFNDLAAKKKGFDKYQPSKIYEKEVIDIPDFLPENPKIRQEVTNYYNSVKRGDDCVGAVLNTLQTSKYAENTVVILISDHGMPLPYAKSSVYENGVRVPLIVKWTNKVNPNMIHKKTLVSTIDLAPTILEMADIDIPNHFQGKSFLKNLNEDSTDLHNYVFAQFDENAGGIPRPSRTVINDRFGYIFNPWATGDFEFKSAASSHTSYKAMKALAATDKEVKKHFDNWVFRSVEELYDYKNDPDALNNLIADPQYKDLVSELQQAMLVQMQATDDYVLEAYENKSDKSYLNKWMKNEIKEANKRAQTIQWKRPKNSKGPTKSNTKLYETE